MAASSDSAGRETPGPVCRSPGAPFDHKQGAYDVMRVTIIRNAVRNTECRRLRLLNEGEDFACAL